MNLGLVCISEILKEQDKSLAFKTMSRSQFLKGDRTKNIAELSRRILHNSSLVHTILGHCDSLGITHYRVSSTLIPLVSDPSLGLAYSDLPDWKQICHTLKIAGDFARFVGISLSMHPDQYCVLASYNPDVVQRSINELNHQSYILDLLGAPQNYAAPMCLHLNAAPQLKKESLEDYRTRFFEALSKCDPGVRARLVLENEDKSFWNCQNLHEHFGDCIPLVYDNLHDACNPCENLKSWPEVFVETWSDFRPIFHWSEGINGSRSHTDYASHVPDVVLRLSGVVTWEVELKAKDKAIRQILEKK